MDNINLAASQDPSHPSFGEELGKILGTVVLGATIAGAATTPGGALGLLTNPTALANIISGFVNIWVKPKSSQ